MGYALKSIPYFFLKQNSPKMQDKKRYRINIQNLEAILEKACPNPGQKRALEGLVKWFMNWESRHNQKQPAILAAFAGYGKSYLFSLVVLTIIRDLYVEGLIQYSDEFELTLAAPSNAASEVMQEFSSKIGLYMFCNVRCTTVHSYSGIVLGELNEKAERIQSFLDRDEETTSARSLLIVDEYGMLSDYIYNVKLANYHLLPILYIGNLEQLSSVDDGGRKPGTSIIDELHPHNYFTLNQPMRNAGKIFDYSRQILHQYIAANLAHSRLLDELVEQESDYRLPTTLADPSKTVLLPAHTDDSLIVGRRSEVLGELVRDGIVSRKMIDKDYHHFKIFAYTNKAVDDWNTIIRRQIFGDESKRIHVGETFIVKAPIYEYVLDKQVKIFFTNQRIKLQKVELIDYPLIDRVGLHNSCVKFPGVELRFYQLTATNRYGREKNFLYPTTSTFQVLMQFFVGWWKLIDKQTDPVYKKAEYNNWEKQLAAYGLIYKETKKDRRSERDIPFKYLVMPDYAATIHSFQGGTCDHVVLDWDNIQSCRLHDTRYRLTYTGTTRAGKKLYICTNPEY